MPDTGLQVIKSSVGGKKKLQEFHCNLPQNACGWLNLFARHNFSKPRRDFVDSLYVF
jgi:hypothetical protein